MYDNIAKQKNIELLKEQDIEGVTDHSIDLSVNIGGIEMKNPVMTSSGTFGYGEEYADFVDLSRLGAIVVKGITQEERSRESLRHLLEC